MRFQIAKAAFVTVLINFCAVSAMPAGKSECILSSRIVSDINCISTDLIKRDFVQVTPSAILQVKRDGVALEADVALTEDTQLGEDYYRAHDY